MAGKTYTVSNWWELVTVAKRVRGGDTVLLAPGNYGDVSLSGIRPTGTVTFKSADPNNDAVIRSLRLSRTSNLVFEDLDINHTLHAGQRDSATAVFVTNSNDISFVGVDVRGSMNGNRNDDGNGMTLLWSQRVAVIDSTFQQLNNAVVLGRLDDVILAGNTIRDVREGVNMSQINGGLFERNYLTEIIGNVARGDHSDAFQIHAAGDAIVSNDIVFRSNVIVADSQGIFIRTERPGAIHTNITIENNYYEGNARNAIQVTNTDNLAITGNSVREGAGGGMVPGIVVGWVSDAVISNNIAPIVMARGDSTNSNLTFGKNIDVWDGSQRSGVAVSSVFAAPQATGGDIDFSSLNARSGAGVDTANIGFRNVGGIGNLSGSAAAQLATYIPQFDTSFSHFLV